jgi:ribosome maturation factor RimP
MERAARRASVLSEESPQIIEAFERIAHGLPTDAAFRDVEIVSTSARRQRDGFVLRLIIDRPGGIDVATCEHISRRLNSELDRFADPYTLSVESAGLERPLVRPSDYERFRGSAVKLTTTLAIGGAKTHRGRLAGIRGTNVMLSREQGELPIPLALIKHANIEYDIRADLTKAKRERRHKR